MTLTCHESGFVAKNKGGLSSHLRSHKRRHDTTLSANSVNTAGDKNTMLNTEIANVYPICSRSFHSKSGKSNHMRKAHAEAYHEVYAPIVRVKARWSEEEMTLVARDELRLRREGYKGSINVALNANFPTRSAEAIKGLR